MARTIRAHRLARMTRVRLAVLGLSLAMASAAHASLSPSVVPTFQLRAHVLSVSGTAPTTSAFSFTFSNWNDRSQSATVSANGTAWSDWLPYDAQQVAATLSDYPANALSAFPVQVHLSVSGVVDPTVVEAQLRFDENGTTVTLTGELFGPHLGILIWRDGNNAPQAATMADYNHQHYWSLLNGAALPANQRPSKFILVDQFIGVDDDRRNWSEGIQSLAGIGMTALKLPPSKSIRSLMLQAGLTRVAGGVYCPPGYTHNFTSTPPTTAADVDAWAQQQAQPYLAAGYAPTDMALFALSDEPAWFYPQQFRALAADPNSLARFHSYLAAQNLQPADVGASSWDQVMPLGRSQALDLPSRRLFYWTMRFFSEDSSRYFAQCTGSLEKAFYPNLPVYTNFNNFNGRLYEPGPILNNPDSQSPDASVGGHDWLEFGRLRGGTMLWTEDWFGDHRAYLWSFYAAKLRSAAAKSGGQFGGYIVPRMPRDQKDGLMQKVLCLVGNGAKAIEYFTFGPEYNFPGNCYSETPQRLLDIAAANQMIGSAEDLLWAGNRPRAQVAILAPRSAEVWDAKGIAAPTQISDHSNPAPNWMTVDYMEEVLFEYLALQHANIPVDFVDEDDLSLDGLKPYRVLYATEPNIPAAGQRGIAEWVRSGGTLVTVEGAGAHDEYDDPCDVLTTLAGIQEPGYDRILMDNQYVLPQAGTGSGPLGDFTAFGTLDPVSSLGGRLTPLLVPGSFDNGAGAVTSRRVREGRVVHYAWMPGIAYGRQETEPADQLPSGFSDAIRSWITYPTQLANVQPPVLIDHPLVEAPILLSSGGAAVTLLNWNTDPLPSVNVTVRVPFTVRQVASSKSGQLTFQQTQDGVAFSMPLGAADVVTLRP